MDDTVLDIVIVSYNTRDMLRECLGSIPDGLAGLSARVWVVDNASTDGTLEMIRSEFPSVDLIASSENLGFTRGNNMALSRTSAPFLLLLNPDTVTPPGSLLNLYDFLKRSTNAGAAGPMLLNSDGSLQKNGSREPMLLREALLAFGLNRLAPSWFDARFGYARQEFGHSCPADVVSGACMLVRREAVQKVGLLDEGFFMFYEEVDWCKRMRNAGIEVWYCAESSVVHHWMGSVRLAPRKMTDTLYRSQVRYYEKHWPGWRVPIIRMLSLLARGKNWLLHTAVSIKRRLVR